MLAAVLLSASSPWQVAYVARVYYPAGDRRISRFQVYLSDLQGRRTRQATRGREDCAEVRWLDRATIAWTRDDGTLWRMRVDGGRPRLWKRTVREWGRVLTGALRGSGTVFPLVPVPGAQRPEWANGAAGEWVGAAKGCDVHPKDVDGALVDAKGDLNLQPVPEATEMYGPATAFCGPGRDDLWVVYRAALSSWGSYYSLVRYDRSTGKALWRRGEIKDLDFRIDRPLYARTTVRKTAVQGKLHLWTAPIYVGDWRSGREWKLTRGFVEALAVSLRP